MLWATAATNEKPLETKRASCSKQDDNGGSGGNENKTVYPYKKKAPPKGCVCLHDFNIYTNSDTTYSNLT